MLKVWIHQTPKIDAKRISGEILPPTPEGLLKVCVDVSFKNTSLHPKSGQVISTPPNLPDQGQYEVGKTLEDECARVLQGIYGKELSTAKFESFRICWFVPSAQICYFIL
jgi:hypothetical protein